AFARGGGPWGFPRLGPGQGGGAARADASTAPGGVAYAVRVPRWGRDSSCRARRRRLGRSSSRKAGPTTAKPSRPATPRGSSTSSTQVNQAPPGAGETRNVPVPRTTPPRGRRWVGEGG